MKYSGCQYADGEEITGTTGTWEASVENMQADKVEDEEQKKRNKERNHEVEKSGKEETEQGQEKRLC